MYYIYVKLSGLEGQDGVFYLPSDEIKTKIRKTGGKLWHITADVTTIPITARDFI